MAEDDMSNVLFCSTSSLKIKDIKFVIIDNKENQQIFTCVHVYSEFLAFS